LTEGLPERYAPILPALGPPEAGKGRLLTVCRQFFYRSILFQKTKRVPSIFRTLQPYHHATLLLEEADLDESTESADLVEFLNSRASGHPAVRWSTETERAHWFLNLGYTILAIRRPYEDAGLTSRTIPFPAESTGKDLPLVAPMEFATSTQRQLEATTVIEAGSLTRVVVLFRVTYSGTYVPLDCDRLRSIVVAVRAVGETTAPAAVAADLARFEAGEATAGDAAVSRSSSATAITAAATVISPGLARFASFCCDMPLLGFAGGG
jgi:hypothetical protein